ncbi:MAG: hypothetical protein ACE5LA_04885 [Dehalococcoidales bacterium]
MQQLATGGGKLRGVSQVTMAADMEIWTYQRSSLLLLDTVSRID